MGVTLGTKVARAPHNSFKVALLLLGLVLGMPLGFAGPSNEKEIVFAGSATYRPFQWIDKEGRPKGFVIDLQESLARQGDRLVEHRLMEWENAIEAVRTGRADIIPLLASEERSEDFDFTEPFYYLSHGIFSHKAERFGTLGELKGKRVAVVSGSYAASRLADDIGNMNFLRVGTERDCLVAVHDRVAEACIEVVNTSRRHAADLQVEQTSAPFWPQPYVFAVRKGNAELLSWLSEKLAMVQADGTYHELYHEWLPELDWHKHSAYDWFKYSFWLLIPIIFIALFGSFFSWYLKRQVRFRTRRLAEELTARRRLEDELRKKADYDELTGLPSRAAFIDNLEHLLQEEPNWSPTVVLIRLLNLEQLTSMFGYHYGHKLLLQSFSCRLESIDFAHASHFGSGVFAVLRKHDMPHEEIVGSVSDSFRIGAFDISAHVVMGISEGRVEGEHKSPSEAEELVRRAMTAYSAAARSARLWHVYSADLEPDPDDLKLVEDFRRIGTRDMFLLYQPKLDLASGYIREAEALVRWQHPTLGMVSPGRFIGLLEETGLITRLTYWALEEAMKEVQRCRDTDPSFGVNVNVSARDLMEGDSLVNFIKNKKSLWFPHGLRLELTETGVIQDHDHAQKVVSALHESGIGCAVDDFGTGYASLSYLSKFSVDEVKLDRSFIYNMLYSERDQAIISSTINLAHKMGLKVTAEGVEDVETLQALAAMGCDTAQGYVIAKPIPAAELYKVMGKRYFVNELGIH
jgi:EAL domain-containing protein (putative c-di-GMP-specific phosphodiesterase class I)/ABC-type amino acid transport substrate-binding protein/GGDEF domain-containing protein